MISDLTSADIALVRAPVEESVADRFDPKGGQVKMFPLCPEGIRRLAVWK